MPSSNASIFLCMANMNVPIFQAVIRNVMYVERRYGEGENTITDDLSSCTCYTTDNVHGDSWSQYTHTEV